MQRLWMYGAGGHARVIYDIIQASNNFVVVGFIDDDEQRSGEDFLGYELITDIYKYEKKNAETMIDNVFLSIGDNIMREKIAERMKHYTFPVITHANSVISRDVKIGCGTVIMPGVVIEPGTVIGDHCIINNGAIIGHCSRIADYCHVSGNAVVSGEANIGKGSLVAIGACVTPRVNVGEKCVIGAGAVISRDIPDGSRMVGNPARNMSNFKHSC